MRYGTGSSLGSAVTANISSTGIFISTEDPPSPGRDVLINLLFPDGCVTVCGEVVWSRERLEPGRRTGFGVRLKEFPPDYLYRLQRMPSLDDTHH